MLAPRLSVITEKKPQSMAEDEAAAWRSLVNRETKQWQNELSDERVDAEVKRLLAGSLKSMAKRSQRPSSERVRRRWWEHLIAKRTCRQVRQSHARTELSRDTRSMTVLHDWPVDVEAVGCYYCEMASRLLSGSNELHIGRDAARAKAPGKEKIRRLLRALVGHFGSEYVSPTVIWASFILSTTPDMCESRAFWFCVNMASLPLASGTVLLR